MCDVNKILSPSSNSYARKHSRWTADIGYARIGAYVRSWLYFRSLCFSSASSYKTTFGFVLTSRSIATCSRWSHKLWIRIEPFAVVVRLRSSLKLSVDLLKPIAKQCTVWTRLMAQICRDPDRDGLRDYDRWFESFDSVLVW
jgi:hypothetical protein